MNKSEIEETMIANAYTKCILNHNPYDFKFARTSREAFGTGFYPEPETPGWTLSLIFAGLILVTLLFLF